MKMNGKSFAAILLIFSGIGLYLELFILSYVGGDMTAYESHKWFPLIKTHLLHEWSIPYFTPGRCGGFLLAADATCLIFSLYMVITFFIPNLIWAIKIANLILTIVFATGIYRWLKYFEIESRIVRLFVSLLISVSGYWIFLLTNDGGALWMHGIAYIPWVMVAVEELLANKKIKSIRFLNWYVLYIGLSFLMINGGYWWLQSAPFLLFIRLTLEFFDKSHTSTKSRLTRIGFIIAGGLFAILLSWPRIGAVYEFNITKFPREGGVMSHLQVIGEFGTLFNRIFRSFFDARIIISQEKDAYLGPYLAYTNFIGLAALIPLFIGLSHLKRLIRFKPFLTLIVASFIQLTLTRSTHAGDLLRFFIPLYNQITYYWRGASPTWFFTAAILIATGYQTVLSKCYAHLKFPMIIGVMLINLAEIHFVYATRLDFSIGPPLSKILHNENSLSKPLTTQCVGCYAGSFIGYAYMRSLPNVISADLTRTVFDSSNPEFYNLHDVRRLASTEANGAYFRTNKWPLWPKKDAAEFERFINYKQVVQLPPRLKFMNRVSFFAWKGFALIGFLLLFIKASVRLRFFSKRFSESYRQSI